jgi:hypothetical protein
MMSEALRKAAGQAVDALECGPDNWTAKQAISDLRAALAEPEQDGNVCARCGGIVFDPVLKAEPDQSEPVATITSADEYGPLLGWHTHWAQFPVGTNLYTGAVRKPSQMLTDVRAMFAAAPPRREPLTAEEYTELAHRISSKYAHRSDPKHIAYTFLPHTLEQFVRSLEAAHGIGVKP